MTAGDIRPDRRSARGGRAARRAHKIELEADFQKARGVLSNDQMKHEQAWAEKLNCPICRQAVHPTNWSSHMEQKHPKKTIPLHEVEPGRLPLTAIRVDGGTQPRAQMNPDVIHEYAEDMRNGDKFKAIDVYFDGQDYWLADGFHRVQAAQEAGLTDIRTIVYQGTQRDAILHSVGVNRDHGLRRTNDDKRRAVERLLRDEEWSQWSNREIARRCGVDEKTVRNFRDASAELPQITERKVERGGTTYTQNTSNIGKSTPPTQPFSDKKAAPEPSTPPIRYGRVEDDYQPDVPEVQVDGEREDNDQEKQLGGRGATVRARSGQTGTLDHVNGRIAYVQTDNGLREYDALYLRKVDTPAADQPKHWGLSNGTAFWTQVHKFNLPRETILEQLQPDAKVLTDLRMTRDDVWVRLNQIATERTASLFPVGSYAKTDHGSFGEVKQAHAHLIRVFDLTLKAEATWYIDKSRPSTEAEYLASLEENKPDPEIDLPKRQVEFLVALAQGVAVNKNAATRMALRGHGYISPDDEWTQITLTEAGITWLREHGFETPDNFNYKRDSRTTRPSTPSESQPYDRMQTPAYALDPLLPYLGWSLPSTIWEPACGEGLIVEALYDAGWTQEHVIGTDILSGQSFFEHQPDHWEVIVTNPPYSLKIEWIERCYALGKPFALLLPIEALGLTTVYPLLQAQGFEIMLLDSRVDFKMPNKGWDSQAQFGTFWLCHDLLPEKVMFGEIKAAKKAFKAEIGDMTDDDPE